MPEPYVTFLEHVVKGMVSFPEDVRITKTTDELGVLLSLRVNDQDNGRVIGRSGSTAQAMRTLLRVVGMNHNARVNLKIISPEKPASGDPLATPIL